MMSRYLGSKTVSDSDGNAVNQKLDGNADGNAEYPKFGAGNSGLPATG